MNERQAQQRPAPTDPSGIEAPHDILAAEEFGIGTRDERWPADPTGIAEPHDVLAAEEFAMPVGGSRGEAADESGRQAAGCHWCWPPRQACCWPCWCCAGPPGS